MPDLLERLGIELPVLQAGMGGGIDGHALAAAVSEGGGLGTIGMLDPGALRAELARARQLTAKPIAINLLLPFARAEHWRIAQHARVVVTFWGPPRRRMGGIWIHQCGSVGEARAAAAQGADAVIAQGVEAGGHVRGTCPALELLERVRAALPEQPVLVAGGIAGPEDVRLALSAGASGVVAGTRFLLSDESAAHPEYKRRLIDADHTILTELFGLGWPAPHRVVANAATERWLGDQQRGPQPVLAVHRVTAPLLGRLPLSLAGRVAHGQRLGVPLFGPFAPLASSSREMVDTAPLFAGETVARIRELRPAGRLARELAG